jgi:hypothetical protein
MSEGDDLDPWEAEAAGRLNDEPEPYRAFDLEERTARFGEAAIDFLEPFKVIRSRTRESAGNQSVRR